LPVATVFFHKYLLVIGFSIAWGYWQIGQFCRADAVMGNRLDLLVDGEWILIATFASLFSLLKLNIF